MWNFISIFRKNCEISEKCEPSEGFLSEPFVAKRGRGGSDRAGSLKFYILNVLVQTKNLPVTILIHSHIHPRQWVIQKNAFFLSEPLR